MVTRYPMSLSQAMTQGQTATRRYGRLDSTPTQIASLIHRLDFRLTIYPPGTNRREAQLLHFAALGTTWFGLIALGLVLILVSLAVNSGAGIAATIAVLGVWVLVFSTSARLRRQTVVLRASMPLTQNHSTVAFLQAVDAFDRLDKRDDLDTIGYELEWGRIYNTAKGDHA